MQYQIANPAEYIEKLPDDWRWEKVEALRLLIEARAPHLREGVNYNMLSYSDEKGIVFHLGVQKRYVTLYSKDVQKVDPMGSLLRQLEVGEGFVRIRHNMELCEHRLGLFIERAVSLRKCQGEGFFWKGPGMASALSA